MNTQKDQQKQQLVTVAVTGVTVAVTIIGCFTWFIKNSVGPGESQTTPGLLSASQDARTAAPLPPPPVRVYKKPSASPHPDAAPSLLASSRPAPAPVTDTPTTFTSPRRHDPAPSYSDRAPDPVYVPLKPETTRTVTPAPSPSKPVTPAPSRKPSPRLSLAPTPSRPKPDPLAPRRSPTRAPAPLLAKEDPPAPDTNETVITPSPDVPAPTSSPSEDTTTIDDPAAAGLVWVNTKSNIYWKPGTKYYGKTTRGKYMTEADAVKEGYRPSKTP